MKQFGKYVPFLMLFMVLTFNACSKDEVADDNQYSSELSNVASDLITTSKSITINKDLILQNYEDYMSSLYSHNADENELFITLEDIANEFQEQFGIPTQETMRLFEIFEQNQYLLDIDPSGELLIAEIKEQVKSDVEGKPKFVFNALYEMFGDEDDCALGVMAAFADTVAAGVAAVGTAAAAPATGGTSLFATYGAYVAFGAAYATTVYRVANCT